MPVVVFIHGGSFATGSGSLDPYNASILAANQSIIVITLNYRVGPLGFAYFGEETQVKGNMGLLDQQMALKWIYENIGHFNGNNKEITLMGHSAGAASVTAHLLSNNSHEYFKRIIVHSGAITNVWATVPQEVALNNTMWLASILNCTKDEKGNEITKKEDIIKCMQNNVTTDDLNDNQFTTRDAKQPPLPYTYLPISNDTVFFNDSLFQKLYDNRLKTGISTLYGRVSDEGSYFLPFLLGEDYGCGFNHSLGSDHPNNQCKGIMNIVLFFSWFKLGNFLEADFWAKALLGAIYTKDVKPDTRDKAIKIFGDFMFDCDTALFSEISDLQCKKNSYYFEFHKRSKVTPWPLWMGVMHGYELEYVFGRPFRYPENYTVDELQYEQNYSTRVMKIYGNFAETGSTHANWNAFKIGNQNECKFYNDKCVILSEGLTDYDPKFNYTKVISDKCYYFNRVANKNPPRLEPKQHLYNFDTEKVKEMLDNGYDFASAMSW
uniref:Acetylcholinesterase n=1 Tax=Parastrongyloides trichosuri TaxID=131310 RepID=A0A0N4Z097_PARTI